MYRILICDDDRDIVAALKIYLSGGEYQLYAEAHERIDKAYRDEKWWAKAAILNVANTGKFTSDRTIEEYVRDIWHLKKVTVDM